MLLALALTLSLAATPADALKSARDHLTAGRLDDVLFALEGLKLEGAEAKEGAKLLTEAGALSLKKDDPILALQFASLAVRHGADGADTHEVLARAYKAQQQFGPAEEHADKWIALSLQGDDARLFRGQLALEQGDWELALGLANALRSEPLTAADQQLVEVIRKHAKKEIQERSAALSTARSLESKLEHALAEAKRVDARNARAGVDTTTVSASNSSDVVVYSTAWCGYCTKAKNLLKKLGVKFVEKDIEKDPAAQKELAQKAARAGVQPRGVPVVDVRGKLVLGYNEERIRQLVR